MSNGGIAVAVLASMVVFVGGCASEPLVGVAITEGRFMKFADIKEARTVLTACDSFVEALSRFDKSARMKTDRDVTDELFLDFLAENAEVWPRQSAENVSEAIRRLGPKLEAYAHLLPARVLLVYTSDQVEAGAAHTRGNAIVLPRRQVITSRVEVLEGLICHELFHVISRTQPELRDKLYEIIGFRRCSSPELPPDLNDIRITNPDAPDLDCCIKVSIRGQSTWAVPILYSNSAVYDTTRGGNFFDYLVFQLLPVDLDESLCPPAAIYRQARPVSANRVSGFFSQIGRNTGYIIHPDEILADNFKLLVLGGEIKTPEIIEQMKAAMAQREAH